MSQSNVNTNQAITIKNITTDYCNGNEHQEMLSFFYNLKKLTGLTDNFVTQEIITPTNFIKKLDNPYLLQKILEDVLLFNAVLKYVKDFLLYLYFKHNITVPQSYFLDINIVNYQYVYFYYKYSLSLKEITSIKHFVTSIPEMENSNNSEKNNIASSLLTQSAFRSFFNINFEDIDDIFIEKAAEKLKDILQDDKVLNVYHLIENEDFFLAYYDSHPDIKQALFASASSLPLEHINLLSSHLFELLIPVIQNNEDLFQDENFIDKYFKYLQNLAPQLILKSKTTSEEQIENLDIMLELLSNFQFKDTPEHKHFFQDLIFAISQVYPNDIWTIAKNLNTHQLDSHSTAYCFHICVQYMDLPCFTNADKFSHTFLINNINSFRNRFLNSFNELNTHDYQVDSLHQLICDYHDNFNFIYNDKPFYESIINDEVKQKVFLLHPVVVSNILSFVLDLSKKPLMHDNFKALNFFFDIYKLSLLKTEEYFQNYYDSQVNINNLLKCFENRSSFQQKQNLKNFYHALNMQDNADLLHCLSDMLSITDKFFELKTVHSLINEQSPQSFICEFDSLDQNDNCSLTIKLDDLNILNFNHSQHKKAFRCFSDTYYHNNKLRIQENLITNILYSAQHAINLNYDQKPNVKILESMLVKPKLLVPPNLSMIPPIIKNNNIVSVAIHKHHNAQIIEFNDLLEILFHDENLFDNVILQRFLFVFYFNNNIYNFLHKDLQEKISQSIHKFLMKNYVFEQGYNFNDEIIKYYDLDEYKSLFYTRNFFIQLSFLISSPKFASHKILNDLQYFQKIYPYLPSDNLQSYNKKLVPLIKSLYLNICATIDFVFEKKSFDGYNKLFNVISKTLLQELYDLNHINVDNKTSNFNDVLDLLFNEYKNLTIKKFRLYPEIKEYLEKASYNVFNNALTEDEVIKKNQFNFLKTNNDCSKKFFMLFLFMSDDQIISDMIHTFFYTGELSSLKKLFASNNLLSAYAPQIFSLQVTNNTFTENELQCFFESKMDDFFFENNLLKTVLNKQEKDSFFSFIEQFCSLKKYNFFTHKINLSEKFKDASNLEQFLHLIFDDVNSKTLSFSDLHYLMFDIIDFNPLVLKNFLLQNHPYIFLVRSLDNNSRSISHNIFQFFDFSREDMLSAIKNTFIDNERALNASVALYQEHISNNNFLNWVQINIEHLPKDAEKLENIQNYLEDTYSYFFEGTKNIPEFQLFLISVDTISRFFPHPSIKDLQEGYSIVLSQSNDETIKNFYLNFVNNDIKSSSLKHFFALKYFYNKLNINTAYLLNLFDNLHRNIILSSNQKNIEYNTSYLLRRFLSGINYQALHTHNNNQKSFCCLIDFNDRDYFISELATKYNLIFALHKNYELMFFEHEHEKLNLPSLFSINTFHIFNPLIGNLSILHLFFFFDHLFHHHDGHESFSVMINIILDKFFNFIIACLSRVEGDIVKHSSLIDFILFQFHVYLLHKNNEDNLTAAYEYLYQQGIFEKFFAFQRSNCLYQNMNSQNISHPNTMNSNKNSLSRKKI